MKKYKIALRKAIFNMEATCKVQKKKKTKTKTKKTYPFNNIHTIKKEKSGAWRYMYFLWRDHSFCSLPGLFTSCW